MNSQPKPDLLQLNTPQPSAAQLEPSTKENRFHIDKQSGFVYVNGAKICRIDRDRGVLIFMPHNQSRLKKKTGRVPQIEVRPDELVGLFGG